MSCFMPLFKNVLLENFHKNYLFFSFKYKLLQVRTLTVLKAKLVIFLNIHHFRLENYRFKGYHLEISDLNGANNKTCYTDTSEPYPALYQNNTCEGTGQIFRLVQTNVPSEIIQLNGPLLEVCEVEVYGECSRYNTRSTRVIQKRHADNIRTKREFLTKVIALLLQTFLPVYVQTITISLT